MTRHRHDLKYTSLPLAALYGLALVGCIGGGGGSGSETDATTSTTSTTGTTAATETGSTDTDTDTTAGETDSGLVSTAGPEHCGTITSDEIWAADLNPHVVTCDVHVEGGTLTIGPGTEVLFVNDVGLRISEEGGSAGLEVLGTADEPVRFAGESGQEPGQWRGLGVFPAAGDVSLAYASIDAAGGFNAVGALMIEGAEVHVDHLTVTNADEWGLNLRRHGRLSADSVGLEVHGTIGWPVQIDPNWVDSLPAVDSDYTGNENDGIYIKDSGTDWRDVVRSAQWEDLGVAYYAIDSIRVEGEALDPAHLTLLDGVTVRFAETARLGVALEGGAAGIVTKGTAERPVVLTSLGSNDRGAWSGVELRDNADDSALRFENTIIEWGGGFNSLACLETEEVEVFADGLTLRGCEKAGFLMRHGAFAEGSAGLTVTDSDRVGELHTPQAHTVPVDGVELTGNDSDALWVVQIGGEKMTKAATWRDIGVPYRVEDYIGLEGTAQDPAVLTLEAGVVLAFASDTRVDLSRDGGASGLRAQGTAEAPVIFTSAEAFDPGAWAGILIFDAAVDAETVIENAEIRWGGGFNSEANVRITDAAPTFKDTVIGGSDCWGIELLGDASPTLDNVTFDGNKCGDVKP